MKKSSIDPSIYVGEIGDAVFDMISSDTFIAGIATSMFEGIMPDLANRRILTRGLLSGSRWCLSNGQYVDLSEVEEVQSYARQIECVRRECLRCIEK
jgi:hypothetical protein